MMGVCMSNMGKVKEFFSRLFTPKHKTGYIETSVLRHGSSSSRNSMSYSFRDVYVARNKDGHVVVFNNYPHKNQEQGIWEGSMICFFYYPYDNVFSLKWDDDRPSRNNILQITVKSGLKFSNDVVRKGK